MTTKGYLIPLVFVAPKLSRILGNFPSPRFILVITGVTKSRKGPKRPAQVGGGVWGQVVGSRVPFSLPLSFSPCRATPRLNLNP